ncbi:MAG: histidine kinase [Terrimesophilobacter sp.]
MVGDLRRWWSEHWRNVIFDGAPPLVLLALGVIDSLTGVFTEPIGEAPVFTSLIPGAVACLALLLRRYRPLLTIVIVLVALTVPPLILSASLTYWDEFMVWVLALYSCGRHASRPIAFAGLGLSAAAMAILTFEFAQLREAGGILFNSALLVAGFSIGMLARSWAGYRERIVRIAADRAVAEERAGRRERARIARELHDVIAHTITVIVMQAGGARLASATNPAIAAATLTQIEELGRASLAELRTLLPLLRDGNGDEPAATEPTLTKVVELCERMRGLGLPVRLRLEGDTGGVPSGMQLIAYRVVQEGLTNVVRHSGMIDTEVRIIRCNGPDRLSIDVENRIPVGASRQGNTIPGILGAGRGLAGLEERVRLVGGEFSVDTRHGSSFLLHVELPIRMGQT